MSERTDGAGLLVSFSDALAEAAERAGRSVLRVAARGRFPSSGVAYQADTVLTADHTVEREEGIRVGLADGRELAATLVGRDTGSDLALLRLESAVLTPADVAEREARVGQLALALGRPSEEGLQASLGVVSAVGGPARTTRGGMIERYLRTDATPYPGFSGGPLVDAEGRVLGINTSGLAMGTSLAIAAAQAWQVGETLARHGRVRRGYLGIRTQAVTTPPAQRQALGREQEGGLLVLWVQEDSPASLGGLMIGDIITAIDGQAVTEPDQLQSHLMGLEIGRTAEIEVLRGAQRVLLAVAIGEQRGGR